MTTFTTEDRLEAEKCPSVIVDSGAGIMEPIPFAGLVNLNICMDCGSPIYEEEGHNCITTEKENHVCKSI